LIEKLFLALVTHELRAFACTIDAVAYRDIWTQSEQDMIRDTETFCLPECFRAVSEFLPKPWPHGEKVGFVFDQDNPARICNVGHLFMRYQETHEWMGSLQFADKREMVPLQAADLLAHQAFQAALRGHPRGVLHNLLTCIPPHRKRIIHLDRESLLGLHEGLIQGGILKGK
jgi:hypothetical protein